MFKKPIIKHHVDSKALIYQVPGSDFKKGQTLEIPQGYEACMFRANGAQELIQDVYKYKLTDPVQYIYLSKSNRAAIHSKWGTPNRFKVQTANGVKTLGAFGQMEFQLLNPIRFLEKQTNREGSIDEALITQLVLARISEAFQDVIPSLEPFESTQEIQVIKKLKEPLQKTLDLKLSKFGMSVASISIDSVNFQAAEEA